MAAKQSKKQRKWDRNRLFCQGYRNRNQREKNKVRRITRHLKKFPNDRVATRAVDLCRTAIRGY
jgi:hypothetical protein